MKEYIKELLVKRELHAKKIREIDNAVKAIQDVCEHSYEKTGHDSHHVYSTCTICGHEIQD